MFSIENKLIIVQNSLLAVTMRKLFKKLDLLQIGSISDKEHRGELIYFTTNIENTTNSLSYVSMQY